MASHKSEREQVQLPVNTSMPGPPMAFATMNHQTYEEMMALAAAAILEEWMVRMSHSSH